jgi:hypothetical protein
MVLFQKYVRCQRSEMSGTILEGITQGSFQHSLVEIGSVVSEEKIILKNSSLFFYF